MQHSMNNKLSISIIASAQLEVSARTGQKEDFVCNGFADEINNMLKLLGAHIQYCYWRYCSVYAWVYVRLRI